MREITTSGIRPPRNDSTETREITTSEPAALPRNDVMDSAVIARERSDCGNLKEQVVYAIIKNHWCRSTLIREIPTKIYDFLGMTAITPPTSALKLLFVMTFPVVAFTFVLSFAQIGEARADEIPSEGVSGTCNAVGTCLWKIDSKGKMTVYAAPSATGVVMANYTKPTDEAPGNRPWETYIEQIKNLVVEENIKNIGQQAFRGASKLETVTGMKDVESIEMSAFAYASSLTSVDMPNVKNIRSSVFSYASSLTSVDMSNVETIGASAFAYASSLSSLDMPNIKSIRDKAFNRAQNLHYVGMPEEKEITIEENAFLRSGVSGCSNENRAACGSCGYTQSGGYNYIKYGVGCVKHCGDGLVGKGNKCVEGGCGEGYIQVEDWCNRVIYTPAEAAEVLNDDNTNFITITFRK